MILSLWFWLAATVGHFLLSARWARRATRGRPVSIDEYFFNALLVGVGSLSVLLHVVTISVGLTLGHVLLVLALWHAGCWRLSRGMDNDPVFAKWRPDVIEIAAVTVMAAIVFTWIDVASRSSGVSGTDAAHYHVPFAVNLMLGASPFDLPATPHLYPMAGSVVDAWFMVPTHDPLLVDLTMCLPFLLLAASINWIFRLSTDLSGLMWSSWMTIALFSTPLFRTASLVSADLWFAAAFIAISACVLACWIRETWTFHDVCLGGLATGLLLGSKASGFASATLILVAYGAAESIRSIRRRRLPRLEHPIAAISSGLVLTLGAGGIWLVRNWLRFGSPLAPAGLTLFGFTVIPGATISPTTYLSVLGDLRGNPSYRLWVRTSHFVRIWLGSGFLRALVPAVLFAADLIVPGTRGNLQPCRRARVLLLLVAAGAGGALTGLLIGAPWTSLEWTRGLSLRYVLPLLALLPLLSLIGLFPTSWRWYDNHTARTILATTLAVASGLLCWAPPGAPVVGEIVPAVTPWSLLFGIAVTLIAMAVSARSSLLRLVTAGAVLAAIASYWSPVIASRADADRTRAVRAEFDERRAFANGVDPGSPLRAVYLSALADEVAGQRSCDARRFYMLTRDDEPLTLESADYRNRVFYAARNPADLDGLPALGPCDYVVATRAVLETEKGAAEVATLAHHGGVREIGPTTPFVLLGLAR